MQTIFQILDSNDYSLTFRRVNTFNMTTLCTLYSHADDENGKQKRFKQSKKDMTSIKNLSINFDYHRSPHHLKQADASCFCKKRIFDME